MFPLFLSIYNQSIKMSALKRNGAFLSPSPQIASFSLHQHLWNINRTSSLLKSVKTYASYRASLIAHLVKNWHAMQETLVWSLGQEDLLEKGQGTHSTILGLPLVAQLVKNPLAMQETWVQSLGWEDPWRRVWQPTPLQSIWSQRIRHNWATFTFTYFHASYSAFSMQNPNKL